MYQCCIYPVLLITLEKLIRSKPNVGLYQVNGKMVVNYWKKLIRGEFYLIHTLLQNTFKSAEVNSSQPDGYNRTDTKFPIHLKDTSLLF